MPKKIDEKFEPMLAAKFAKMPQDFAKIKFPVLASPKLDGIRCMKRNGILISRKLKPIPNLYLQKFFVDLPEGLDGELIAGDAWDEPYNRTVSAVMSKSKISKDVTFHVFDSFALSGGFTDRYEMLHRVIGSNRLGVSIVIHTPIDSLEALLNVEEMTLKNGYEGLVIRSLDGPYKCGRSTLKEGYLIKIKRFEDSEAVIDGFEERMHNANEAKKDATGHTERSSSKVGLVGRGDLGALLVHDVKTKVEFKIGMGKGLTDDLRKEIWDNRDKWLGKIVKYSFFPVGVKDKPRHPKYVGLRDARDMDAAA